jgi:hypothetical protein
MRFAVGQAFERVADKRQAVVALIRDDGRAGLLRFLDNGQAEWVLWAQFLNSEKWLPIGMNEARYGLLTQPGATSE